MMPDIYSQEKRSEIMSGISGKETRPEILIRKYLFFHGFRYRKNVKELPGKPDIVLSKYKTVILVHGCFWHGHNCKGGKLPETRKEFWKEKLHKNKNRDTKIIENLQAKDWNVIVIWQCEIKNISLFNMRMNAVLKQLREFT